jgi:hypothetical protein
MRSLELVPTRLLPPLLVMLAVFASSVSSASANVPAWSIRSAAVPTNLPPGGTGEIVVIATDLGGASANGSTDPIVLRDELPAGVQATSVTVKTYVFYAGFSCSVVPGGAAVSCEAAGELAPYELVTVHIHVSIAQTAGSSPAVNTFSIAGGEAEPAFGSAALHLSSAPVGFGVESLEQVALNEDGSPDTQAGSHPFGFTTTLQLNEISESGNDNNPVPATVKDLHFDLPPGLIGNPTVNPQCTFEQFSAQVEVDGVKASKADDYCPDDTAVGVVTVWFGSETPQSAPVFNLPPAVGEPARFAFNVLGTPVFLNTAIRSGGDYSVEANVENVDTVLPVSATQLTFWGAPADPGHDEARGWNCLYHGAGTEHLLGTCPQSGSGGATAPPFLTLPTSCPVNPATHEPEPLRSTVEADSWQHPGEFVSGEYTSHDNAGLLGLTGCESLRFEPSVKVTPDGTAASTPTGLTVDEHVPQDSTLDPTGLAESDVKGLSVTLPEGVALNPAAADGLQACSEEQIALHRGEAPGCPDASKVATVKIKTPLLPEPLEGSAYVAAQNANPFGSLVAMYIYAEDPTAGVRVKAAGEVLENPLTGQLTAHFERDPAFEGDSEASQFLPQLAFEDIELSFFGGERAPLATPTHCGAYTTTGTFTPWSGNPASESSSTFDITSGPNGSACPGSSLPFSPLLTGGTTNINAGAFSPLTTTISRVDGEQNISMVQLRLPPGLSGILAGVPLCGEAQANDGTCGAASQVGETIVSVGVGGDPYSVTGGKVYITGPYHGAPFGLSIVTPAVAGPYNLGTVVVRGKLEINPTTAALTFTSNSEAEGYAIPHILDGIPLQIKHVNVSITRPGFTFNPTSCDKASITSTISSAEGASSNVSTPFQVTNCQALKFEPKFSASTSGETSKTDGASLHLKVTRPSGPGTNQANFTLAKIELPKQMPSRLTTLQKACVASVFEANPAACPAESDIGYVKVMTPELPVPLEGPAYFVSHGGEAFPSVIFVLQGYGVNIDVVSTTFISKAGITSATLKTVPDAPFTSFELTFPEGKFSALAANANLCKSKLTIPTAFVAQNGAEIHESTPIAVTGCKPVISVVKHSVKGKTATIVVSVPAAGELTATGTGVSGGSGKSSKAQDVTVKVTLTKAKQALQAKHKGSKLRMKIKLTFAPKKGSKLSTSVTVRLG